MVRGDQVAAATVEEPVVSDSIASLRTRPVVAVGTLIVECTGPAATDSRQKAIS